MARPSRRTHSAGSHIDPSRYRLIPEFTPGPLGYNDAFDPNLRRDQTLSLQLQLEKSHLNKFQLFSKQEREEMFAKPEFQLLKAHITDRTAKEYVERRNRVFGSTRLYEDFAVISDKELEDTPSLRRLIEMGGKHPREIQRQTVFYRWVRKAYLDKGVKNVPALIKAGMSEKLQEALEKVKTSWGGEFKAGGFNPRPQKSSGYKYILGTISEHAFGMAIDIEAASNPILSANEWKFLENFTGKKVDRSRARWKTKPEDLWKDVKEVNELFVAKLPESVKKMEQEIEWAKTKLAIETTFPLKPLGVTGPDKGKDYHLTDKTLTLSKAVDWVLGSAPKLKQYQKGFFTLEWPLVKELQAHDFTWGATFSNVDLHHFQLE